MSEKCPNCNSQMTLIHYLRRSEITDWFLPDHDRWECKVCGYVEDDC